MRDPERIDRMVSLLDVLWHANPDMRLGQLIVNVASCADGRPNVFYIEDDELEEHMQIFFAGWVDAQLEDTEEIDLDEW